MIGSNYFKLTDDLRYCHIVFDTRILSPSTILIFTCQWTHGGNNENTIKCKQRMWAIPRNCYSSFISWMCIKMCKQEFYNWCTGCSTVMHSSMVNWCCRWSAVCVVMLKRFDPGYGYVVAYIALHVLCCAVYICDLFNIACELKGSRYTILMVVVAFILIN